MLSLAQCLVPQQFGVPSIVTAMTFAGMLLLSLWVLRQDRFDGRTSFLLSLGALLWWLLFALLEFSTTTLSCKLYFTQGAWLGIAGVPIGWSVFVYRYCLGRRSRFFRPFEVFGLLAWAFISISALTSQVHGLLYGAKSHLAERDGYIAVVHERLFLYYVCAILLYFFIAVAVAILATASFRARNDQRPYLLMMLFGTLVPIVFNFTYIVYGFTVFGRDSTPYTFSFVLLVFTWAVFTNRMFDLSARARDIAYFGSVDPVMIFDDQARLISANDMARALVVQAQDGQIGNLPMLTHAVQNVLTAEFARGDCHLDLQVGSAHFDARFVPVSRPLADDGTPLGVVVFLRNVTDARNQEARLSAALARSNEQLLEITRLRDEAEQASLLDPLTGLPNRRALDAAFETFTKAPHASDVIALIDLDHFKALNDDFGHAVGDDVLRLFAFELASSIPEATYAFRVGGEEFLVLWPEHGIDEMVALLTRLALKVSGGLQLPVAVANRVSFSAGIAAKPADASSFQQLYRVADARLYRAKRSGRNRLEFDDAGQPDPTRSVSAAVVGSATDNEHAPQVAVASSSIRPLVDEDPLTGLANRRALQEAALQELATSAAAGRPFALMLLDLDNFKSVNDMLRHERGDHVLQLAAERLRNCLGDRGIVARMGGDEFMILAPALDQATATALAEELRALIAVPFDVGPHVVNLTASVGIALYPEHGEELPNLVTSADIALFAAKREGRNCAVVVSEALFNAEERRSTVAQALGSPSLNEALVLYYQPQFSAASPSQLVGAECLLRWRHPVLGEVGPGEFVPIAEQTGTIHRIDAFVLSQAVAQLAKWQRLGWSQRLSVNMSAQSLTRADFADDVLALLDNNHVDPSGLTIEITETMLVALSDRAEKNVSRLKARGIAIAIDDFGTGYASLAYLQRLDVTEIKIDRVFVEGLERGNRRDSEELIRAMISMAKALELTVIAEGVQSETQRDWLVAAGCERIQGALTGGAMTLADFEAQHVMGRAG